MNVQVFEFDSVVEDLLENREGGGATRLRIQGGLVTNLQSRMSFA